MTRLALARRHSRTATATPVSARVSARRATARTAARSLATAAALLVVYFTVPVTGQPTLSAGVWLAVGLAGFTVLMVLQVRSITRSDRPRLRAVEVLATVAPLFLVLFSLTYYALDRHADHAFSEPLSRLDALYFAVTVFATVGFGDIVPRTETARTVVTVQMVGDLVVLGLGLRVLMGAVRIGLTRQRGDSGDVTLPPD